MIQVNNRSWPAGIEWSKDKEPRPLRLATYNLENLDFSKAGGPTLETRISALRPKLIRLDADVICLQEVNGQREKGSSDPRRLLALARLCHDTPYEHYQVATSHGLKRPGVADLHNLVVLSRWPIVESREYREELVQAPTYRPVTAIPPASAADEVHWDRPLLHVRVAHPGGKPLHVINLHLRAPLAAPIQGQKRGPLDWKSVGAWAEGYYLAAMKRGGQALEARLLIERIFDDDPQALIAVCGDCNAEAHETPLRILQGDDEDTDDQALIARQLLAVEDDVPPGGRYSLVHAGRKVLIDHILVSQALHARLEQTQIHNWNLPDECLPPESVAASHHAPIVAVFNMSGT